ncbi:MAG: hypothetical protein II551_04415 [Paludibacteraceae bacterium]|nr:hypothetical protein [Paludibacteraceae bacterium]
MNIRTLIILFLALPLCLAAQEQGGETSLESPSPQKEKSGGGKIFTGFSGGMLLHIGYMFSNSPDKLFSNTGLGSPDYIKGLPKDGACFGLGGTLRVHLLDHIHVGAEGYVSTMPLMRTGSNVRTGWGGAMCDAYTTWGKVRPMVGMTIGGGTMKRLFVPENENGYEGVGQTNYNASYTNTPFFLLDPYIGLEIELNSHIAVMIRIDYMLPFGKTSSELTTVKDDIKWSNFMTPSGPRLYAGFMFGHLKRN